MSRVVPPWHAWRAGRFPRSFVGVLKDQSTLTHHRPHVADVFQLPAYAKCVSISLHFSIARMVGSFRMGPGRLG